MTEIMLKINYLKIEIESLNIRSCDCVGILVQILFGEFIYFFCTSTLLDIKLRQLIHVLVTYELGYS